MTKILDIPDRFIQEMLADWLGAGRAITGKWGVEDWYSRNRGHIILSERTKNYVEAMMKLTMKLPVMK